MNARQAIKALEKKGYVGRYGAGSHYIMRKGERVIVISLAATELSVGMTGKVRSHLSKKEKK